MTMDKSTKTTTLREIGIIDKSRGPFLDEKPSTITKALSANEVPAKIVPRKIYFKMKNKLKPRKLEAYRIESTPQHQSSHPHDQSISLSLKHQPKISQKSSFFRQTVITTVILALFIYTKQTFQSDYCPKLCTCDEIKLQVLCSGDYGAASVPHTLNPGAKRIIINNAQMSQFSGLDYLDKLETLDLAHNKLTSLDFSGIDKNGNLISLNTSHNNIVDLRDAVFTNAFSELTSTIQMNQGVSDILSDLKPLRRLPKINVNEFVLSNNYLTTLKNFTFIRWHRLKYLDLSFNTIYFLEPSSLFGLNKLEHINLRNNQLKQIPTLALHSTTLSLTNTKLPSTIGSSIEYLDLRKNNLNSIQAESFSLLEKAQYIYLDSCSLELIDEHAFKGLHTLKLLSLDNNSLNEVPTRSFSHLKLLRQLRINSNNISSLQPDSFSGLTYLEELQMNNNSLTKIQEGVFDGLDSLKRLEISYNSKLKTVEAGVFDKLINLTFLRLFSNSITSLPGGFTDKLSMLDLRNNALRCGCDLKWLTRWLKKFNESAHSVQTVFMNSHRYTIPNHLTESHALLNDSSLNNELLNITCSGPPALAGKLVVDLPENKLECLKPKSNLNVHIGFASLFIITLLLTFVCMLNFCRNKKHLFVVLKKNLVHNHISMMMPYNQNLHKNVDELRKETQLYGADYETPDYDQRQVYTVNGDQVLYYEPQQHI